jgi:hypothetical protein
VGGALARRRRGGAEAAQHLAAAGAGRGLARLQRHGQVGEVRRHAGHDLGRRRRVRLLLVGEHLEEAARERQPAGEGLVEHRAHAVPVARRRGLEAGGLLGRHVGRRARDLGTLERLVDAGVEELLDEPEIEQDDAAAGGHAHVRRLDVAVQHAGVVEGAQPLGELPQGAAQPLDRGRLGAVAKLGVLHEVGALDELHGEEPAPLVGLELVELRQVGVVDPGERAELALEAVDGDRIGLVQGLQRHQGAQLAVEDLVDVPRSPGAQMPPHLVTPGAGKLLPFLQRQALENAALPRRSRRS